LTQKKSSLRVVRNRRAALRPCRIILKVEGALYTMASNNSHEKVETNVGLLIILVILVVSVGGLVQIVPLFFMNETTQPVEGLKPYDALSLEGRDIYVREGCYVCHSQMIRPFRAETERYGHYSVAGEFIYDRPFQWGSKRTGPDLHRVGGRYSDEWHRVHLINPRDVVPESIMPGYPWLQDTPIDTPAHAEMIQKKMRTLKEWYGHPYTEEEIANAPKMLEGKTEMDAMIAYLQGLGVHIKMRR
jgi:cytochrome c oxidase cbb3-type subunit 2